MALLSDSTRCIRSLFNSARANCLSINELLGNLFCALRDVAYSIRQYKAYREDADSGDVASVASDEIFTAVGQLVVGIGVGSSDVLDPGSAGKVLTSNGVGSLPTWETPNDITTVNDPIWDDAGDLVYATGANASAKLPIGADGKFLKVVAGLPSWQTIPTPTTMANDALWDAAGDLAVGSGANSGSILPVGSENEVLKIVSGVPAWAPDVGFNRQTVSLFPSPSAGFTIAANEDGNDELIHITGSNIASGVNTFNLPASDASEVGQVVEIFSAITITGVVVAASGCSFLGTALTTITPANTAFKYVKTAPTVWTRTR